MKPVYIFLRTAALISAAGVPCLAQRPIPRDLSQASLEDLMNIEVTSVSKKEQKLSRTGAAVFVITQDDIHHSGATNIPDLLRMAPGVNVARISANTWAISIRGFNSRYSDKVLVLVDGRSVYTASFSGVYWDQQDMPMDNIERIEVIRGPGGTVWGANAMNGVINIITKSSKVTQGGLLTMGTGSEETATGVIQYGGKIGHNGTYRAFGKYFNKESSVLTNGREAADGWHGSHGGFRSDWDLSPRDTMTVQGDLYQTAEGQTFTTLLSNRLPEVATLNDRVTVDAGNLLARWNHSLRDGSDMSLQVYYDRFRRVDGGIEEKSGTFDVDFQHHRAIGSRNDVVWGLGYRTINDTLTDGYNTRWAPQQRTDNLYSGFVQDEIRLFKSVWLTVGSKLEHNDYSGVEYEPSARLVWTPSDRQAVWISASQAIRQPSRKDVQVDFDYSTLPLEGGGFGVLKVVGNPNSKAEQLRDYQVGYRAQAGRRLSFDAAAFRSYYHHLQTTAPGAPFFALSPGPPHLVLPLPFGNQAHARTYGAEIFANWDVTNRWRIGPGFGLIHQNVMTDPGASTVVDTRDTPKHQFQLRSSINPRRNLDWDTSLAFVGALRQGEIPRYTRLDTRLGLHIGESLEISISGENLLTPRHLEFGDTFQVNHTLVERSVHGKITWRF
jgi:iron complex outermembrane receptor protein